MEPNMDQIEDYNKPLSGKKRKVIAIAFGVMLALYGLSYLVQSNF